MSAAAYVRWGRCGGARGARAHFVAHTPHPSAQTPVGQS